MTDIGRRLLPHDASLSDNRADLVRSNYPTVTGEDIARDLLVASGSAGVHEALALDRFAPDSARCETCQQVPYRDSATMPSHEFIGMGARVAGVHPSIADGRAHNFDPDLDSAELMTVVMDDPAAEARWNASTTRHRPLSDQAPGAHARAGGWDV